MADINQKCKVVPAPKYHSMKTYGVVKAWLQKV